MICNELKDCYATIKISSRSECISANNQSCVEFCDRRSAPKCEENRKKYAIDNIDKNLVTLYKVDGGMIVVDKSVPVGQKKCDYLFCVEKKQMSIVILVELKGTQVRTALKQVEATYDLYKDFFDSFSVVLCRIIVTNSTPKINTSPEYISLQRKIKKANGSIVIQEKEYKEVI